MIPGENGFWRNNATRIVAIAIVGLLYGFTKLPSLAATERDDLASQFRFTEIALPELTGTPQKSVRKVHPSLERISAWISSIGAGVAIADLDRDGLANDICQVDPRNDKVIITPAPGGTPRYQPFTLDTDSVRYDETMAPQGCVIGDLNEDGQMDLMVYYWGRTPLAFLGTPGKKMSAEAFVAHEIMPGEQRWFTNAAALADIDGDGHLDIIIGNYFQDGANILDAHGSGVEVMHDTKSKSTNGGRNRILLWASATAGDSPSVKFTEAQHPFDEEVARGWTLAAGAVDLDGDLLPELYFANDFGPDRLLRNLSTPGKPRFEVLAGKSDLNTPASFVLGEDSFKGMGVDFGDINGDGRFDIYVSNIATEFGLQEGHFLWLSQADYQAQIKRGVAPYRQESENLGLSRSGWGWDTRLADMNNDGALEALQATGFINGTVNRWPELQSLGTGNDQMMTDPRHWPKFRPGADVSGHQPNAFFVRAKDGRFYNLSADVGLSKPMMTRGIATADVDGDGDLDFALANQWEPSSFIRNDCPKCGAFLGLHLLLPTGTTAEDKLRVGKGHLGGAWVGSSAIGAQVILQLPDGKKLISQADGGTGHSGKRSPDIHFGLGKLPPSTGLKVLIKWRNRDGKVLQKEISVTPGWYTVQLG